MRSSRIITLLLCLLLQSMPVEAKRVVYDQEGKEMSQFFNKKNTRYVINYHHKLETPVVIPEGCELSFRGGGLSGEIEFKNTKLSGEVNLKGSSIKGSVKNKQFDASWLCALDGETNDAQSINEMIEVCRNVFFPKGRYKLVSSYDANGKVPAGYASSIKAHIGIQRNGTHLEGEPGTTFVTEQPLGTICIFSQLKQIENSVSDIVIRNITFEVHNDGVIFHEFMHTIKTIGVNGLLIEGCTFQDFWGDAICLSHYGDTPATGERTRNQNVSILNNIIIGGEHHNNRNGVSVISGLNVTIKGNTIKNTTRKDMPGAIDVEPNNSSYTISNIKIIGNRISGCDGTAGGICINTNGEGGPAHHIIIKNNVIRECRAGLSFVVKAKGASSDYYVSGNYTDNITVPYQFIGDGSSTNWIFKENIFERPIQQDIPGRIHVSNLVLKNNKKKL